MMRPITTAGALAALLLPALAPGAEEPRVYTESVGGRVHVLFGRGGNIGVFAGEETVFLIDDQFAPLTDRIRGAVAGLSGAPVRFLLNTHWHFDHTGGNENFGAAGTIIVAHDNVRERMSTDQLIAAYDREVPASPEGALPVVTFNDSVAFHFEGERIEAFHVPHAHTDGDSMVYFRDSDVLHAGDVFFNRMYPFIDLSSGGSVDGVIAGVRRALELIGPQTGVIPGHGPVSDRAGMEEYLELLTTVRERVASMIAEGRGLEEVLAAQPTREYEERWGGGFLDAQTWLGIVYEDLAD